MPLFLNFQNCTEVSGECHTTPAFSSRKRARGIQLTGGWVDPSANGCSDKDKILHPCQEFNSDSPNIQHVA
jgi:hypothetical protein